MVELNDFVEETDLNVVEIFDVLILNHLIYLRLDELPRLHRGD